MNTIELNGGNKFIADLKTKGNRAEVNTVLDKYDIPTAKRAHEAWKRNQG